MATLLGVVSIDGLFLEAERRTSIDRRPRIVHLHLWVENLLPDKLIHIPVLHHLAQLLDLRVVNHQRVKVLQCLIFVQFEFLDHLLPHVHSPPLVEVYSVGMVSRFLVDDLKLHRYLVSLTGHVHVVYDPVPLPHVGLVLVLKPSLHALELLLGSPHLNRVLNHPVELVVILRLVLSHGIPSWDYFIKLDLLSRVLIESLIVLFDGTRQFLVVLGLVKFEQLILLHVQHFVGVVPEVVLLHIAI